MDEVEELRKEVKRLKARVTRLKERLTEKANIEQQYLQFTGATPAYMQKIREKDEKALKD